MQRVNAEVAKRASGDFGPSQHSSERVATADFESSTPSAQRNGLSRSAPPPPAVQLTLPIWEQQSDLQVTHATADGHYVLRDLLCHQDRDFILAAYSAVLGRAPDPGGFETYLKLLRAGASKVDVVRFLRDSPEGRATGRQVKGLAMASFVAKIRRWPIIGGVVHAFAAIGSREETERQQRIVDGHIFSQFERTQNTSRSAQVVINRALQDLASGYRDLTAYATSIPGHDALQRFLVSNLETKAERNDLTELKTHLTTLVQSRLPREEIGLLEVSLRSMIRNLFDGKADRNAVESAIKKISDAATQLRTETDGRVDAMILPIKESLRILEQSKVDQSVLDVTIAETEANTKSALSVLSESLQALSDSKIDHSAAAAKNKELFEALYAFREEARSGLQEALHFWNLWAKPLIEGKSDRATVDAALERIKVTLDDTRKETQGRIDAADEAAEILGRTLDFLAKSKSDFKSLETVKAENKAALEHVVVVMNSQTRDIKRNLLDQERRLGLLLEEARKRLPRPISSNQIETMLNEEDHLLDALYASFEDIFRGTRHDIMQRQTVYLPYVLGSQAGTSSAPIIDIGCGRGEWLEVLRREGLVGQGVDINRVFLTGCRDLNLDVTEMDGVAFLTSLATNSVGAVTSFHLVEHLNHKTLIALFDAAFHVLRPGGIAIFETPNPRNVHVGSCNFYLDPTHRHPLPPELLQFLLEARGFVDVQIKELHPPPAGDQVTARDPIVNEILKRSFFSAQDYAVIGKKA